MINGEVDTTTDLNTLTTSGLQPKIYGKACPNSPGFGCFVLNIKTSGNGTNGLIQIAIGYLTNNIYVRNSDLVGWASWTKICSNTES